MIQFKLFVLALVLGSCLAQRSTIRHLPKRTNAPSPVKEAESKVSFNEVCPESDGFFADPEQCDKYHACVGGVDTAKLCPDGMVFNDYSPDQEKCDLPYNIDCSKRPKLQTPQPQQHCPRKNGYFGHEEVGICDKFYFCVDGQFNMITCPSGLVFNPKTGICTWPDEAGKTGCNSADIFQFECPKVNESIAQTHPRYADPDDCQYFYVCINGEIPRRNGCRLGQAFDEEKKLCEWVRKVPECAEWYKDRLTDAQLDELENPKPKVKSRVKGPSRRKQAKSRPVVVEEEDDDE